MTFSCRNLVDVHHLMQVLFLKTSDSLALPITSGNPGDAAAHQGAQGGRSGSAVGGRRGGVGVGRGAG